MKKTLFACCMAAWAAALWGCGGNGGGEADADAETDRDTDAEVTPDVPAEGDATPDPADDPDLPPEVTPDSADTTEMDAPDATDPCGGVDCSGHGRCVAVDGLPTCACDSGYYPVGLDCLADPCETGGTCYYVDADGGLDTNPGTRLEPWQTLGRVQDAMSGLEPGDYVLFQRGDSWSDTAAFRIRDMDGAPDEVITFGAYDEGARPQLMAIRMERVSHVTVRDLESVGSDSGPCVSVSESAHVILQDLHAHGCRSNGLHFGTATEYGVLIDNRVWDVGANDALVVHNPMTVTEETKVGDHFWIVDNFVPGDIGEQPVDVATGTDDVPGSRDIKVVGNVLTGGGNGCIALGHGTSVAWVVGNLLGNCTRTETAFAVGIGGQHLENSGTDYQLAGNVIFHNLMPSVEIGGQEPAVPRAFIHHNTIVHAVGRRSAIRSSVEIAFSFDHNIVWPTGTQAHVQLRASEDVTAMDDNWYVPADLAECRIVGQSLSDWSAGTGFDARSECSAVPGLEEPTVEEAADFDSWTTPAFLAHFIPDPGWAGCARHIGAFDCDGNLYIDFQPFAGYDDNEGYGWEGPLIVRQRYGLRD
jgi:hypothetical protein